MNSEMKIFHDNLKNVDYAKKKLEYFMLAKIPHTALRIFKSKEEITLNKR